MGISLINIMVFIYIKMGLGSLILNPKGMISQDLMLILLDTYTPPIYIVFFETRSLVL